MKRVALDTSAYRALEDGDKYLADAIKWADSVGLPIIVVGELYAGFINGTRLAENVAKLDKFCLSPRMEILNIDKSTARHFGEIATLLRQTGKPIQQDDMWIAALCKQYGYVLATTDKDFERVTGLEVLWI